MSLINIFTHIQENWKFVIICVQNQWWVVHPWHGTVANLWGRHKDFTEFNENFEKSYLLNGLSNIVKFFTVWFLKIFCIKWIHIFFWVQCSFNWHIVGCPEEQCECMHVSFCRQLFVLPGARVLKSWHLRVLQPIANLSFICFICQKFHTKQHFVFNYHILHSCNLIYFMLMEFLNLGRFVIHILLSWTRKAFTLSVFLPGTHIHIVLPGRRQILYTPYISRV